MSFESISYSIDSLLRNARNYGGRETSSPEQVYYAVGDIGGTRLTFDVWDYDEKEFVFEQHKEESMEEVESAEDVMDIFSRYSEKKGIDFEDQIYTVSLGCAGVIDDEEPSINLGSNVEELDFTPWENIVRLENDVALAALAEYVQTDEEYSDVGHLNFGTGTNCGFVVNDRIKSSSEIGFIPINFDEERDISAIGRRGVMEAYTSGSGIPNHYMKWREKQGLEPEEKLSAAEIMGRYGEDDDVQDFIEGDLSKTLAAGIATCKSFGLDYLTVGGSVMLENTEEPDLLELAMEHLERQKWDVLDLEEDVRRTSLGKDITLKGALANISVERNEHRTDLNTVPLERFGQYF